MRKGQSVLEYAALIAVVAVALGAMHIYLNRSVQADLKLLEEEVNADVKGRPVSTGGGGGDGGQVPDMCANCDCVAAAQACSHVPDEYMRWLCMMNFCGM